MAKKICTPISFLGVFTKTNVWWNGRPVYKSSKGKVLHHGHGGKGWMIGPELGFYEFIGSRSHHSPVSEQNWKYLFALGPVWKPATITVRES